PPTQQAIPDPNTLDDYEEGTWTPYFWSSGGGGPAATGAAGGYTKVGRNVHCFGHLATNATGGSGTLWISGLPFTSQPNYGGNFCLTLGGCAIRADWIGGSVTPGTTNV